MLEERLLVLDHIGVRVNIVTHVAVTAGLPDNGTGWIYSGADDTAIVNGTLNAHCRSPDIAHRRPTPHQETPGFLCASCGDIDNIVGIKLGRIRHGEHQVIMCFDDPRHEGTPTPVDDGYRHLFCLRLSLFINDLYRIGPVHGHMDWNFLDPLLSHVDLITTGCRNVFCYLFDLVTHNQHIVPILELIAFPIEDVDVLKKRYLRGNLLCCLGRYTNHHHDKRYEQCRCVAHSIHNVSPKLSTRPAISRLLSSVPVTNTMASPMAMAIEHPWRNLPLSGVWGR